MPPQIKSKTKTIRKNKKISMPGTWDDIYTDANPADTIHIKYATLDDVRNTINRLEKIYKSGKQSHTRITKIALVMRVRLDILKESKPEQYALASRYSEFLKTRTQLGDDKQRRQLNFKY